MIYKVRAFVENVLTVEWTDKEIQLEKKKKKNEILSTFWTDIHNYIKNKTNGTTNTNSLAHKNIDYSWYTLPVYIFVYICIWISFWVERWMDLCLCLCVSQQTKLYQQTLGWSVVKCTLNNSRDCVTNVQPEAIHL